LEATTALLPPDQALALRLLVKARRQEAVARQHRLVLVLSGTAAWTSQAAETCLSELSGTWVWLSDDGATQRAPSRSRDPALIGDRIRARQPLAAGLGLLGREIDVLVYDSLGGFDPDSFGAATGALRGGGLLLLLTPPLADWPRLPDPQTRRIAVEPFSPPEISGRFLARLARVLEKGVSTLFSCEQHEIPSPAVPADPFVVAAKKGTDPFSVCRTSDQAEAVTAILRTAHGRARRPLVIVADRGRGKTAALGIAAGRLLAEGGLRILVTAPRRAAVEPLFHHAGNWLTGARVHPDHIEHGTSELRFLPPDALRQGREPAGLLLVDEAAGIPAPLLEGLLLAYPRLVFATTVHGYEGTGRGFEVRFLRYLQRLTPDYRRIELRTPIRWAPDDPLEALVARALLLDARPATDRDLAEANPETCTHARLDRDELAGDEASLSALFGLLVLAHYQTRPLDLRHLLDGPNIEVHVLRHRGQIAATALVAREGGFSQELGRDIYEGRRRPRGHLLPQTLSAHAGLEEAPRLGWARILRIAVHPAAQGRGLGRRLVERIQDQARADGLDLIGSSFGATADLLVFWRRCGLAPVHLGSSRNAASGAHAAVVLRPLSAAGLALAGRAGERFGRRFPGLLAGPFRDLEPAIAARLLAAATPEPNRRDAEPDWGELTSFAYAQRSFEAAFASLRALAAGYLGPALREGRVGEAQALPLIARVMQYRDWPEVADLMGVKGRAEVLAGLRASARCLVASAPGSPGPPGTWGS
jgi:tRNA(Met) cytidine acetyltransferase